MGPELFDPEQVGHKSDQPTEKSDCYALGMTILEVLSGRQPFHYYKDLIVMQKIRNGEQPKIPTGPERVWFTNDLWEMLGLCWLPKPESRPTIEAVLENLEYGVATWEPLPPGLEEETHTYDDDSHSTVTSLGMSLHFILSAALTINYLLQWIRQPHWMKLNSNQKHMKVSWCNHLTLLLTSCLSLPVSD